MKGNTSTLPVQVFGIYAKAPAPGEVKILEWNKQERTQRAIKAWVICWGAAILCVMVPILHFVLVPGLLIAGPFVAYRTSKQESMILGGLAKCPECGAALPIQKSKNEFPMNTICGKCFQGARIERLDPAATRG